MTTADPLSLAAGEASRRDADTILLRATRPADLETPIGAFLRLDDGGPAYLLESVEGGERLGRYSFLGVGPRRLLEVRDGVARIQTRPVTVPVYAPDLPIDRRPRPATRSPRSARSCRGAGCCPSRACRGSPAAPSARWRTTRSRPSSRRVPLPERDPVGVPIGRVHRDGPRPRLRPPDPHAVGDRLAAHRRARPRGPLPDRRGRHLRGARADGAPVGRRAGRAAARGAARCRRPPPPPLRRSPGRDEPRSRRVHPGRRGRQGRHRGRRGHPGRPGASPVVRPAGRSGDRRDRSTASRSTGRSAGSTPARTCSSSGRPSFEVVGASPELLLQVEGDRLTTHPIAGTRPRGADAREDALLAEQLQRDPKERAEHVMLVDLGRNDLGRVARPGTVTVSKYMEVERYSHVLHLVSHVEARLRPELDALDALRSVFPAGTLSGRAEGPRDAAHRRRGGRAARAVRRRRRLSRLRRQPRHRHHDPQRRAQGRPGPRPHRRRASSPARSRSASSRRPSTRPPPCAGRSSIAAGVPGRAVGRRRWRRRRGRRRVSPAREPRRDPRRRQLRQLHVQPRPGAPGGGRRRPRRPQRRDRPRRRRGPRRRPRRTPPRDRRSRPDPATRTTPASRSRPSRWRPTARSRSSASASGCSRWRPAFGATIVRAPTLVHGEASEVTHDGAGLLEGMPPSFYGGPLPLARGRPGDPAARAHRHRDERADRVVMGIRHVSLPLEGVQFHPESVLTPDGPHLLANFLRLAGEGEASGWTRRPGRSRPPGWPRPTPRSVAMSDQVRAALATIVEGGTLSMEEAHARHGRGDGRRGDAGPARRAPHGPAHARRDRRRARRLRDGHARARRCGSMRPMGAIDVVGTGGDGSGTFNISTTAALVAAAAGIPVAKHGNRAITSKAGSADVLDALGIRIDHDAASAGAALREHRVRLHVRAQASIRPCAMPARPVREIGVRTAFNLLGPLTNPAGTHAPAAGVGRSRGRASDRRGRRAGSGPSGRSSSTGTGSTSCRSTAAGCSITSARRGSSATRSRPRDSG